MSLVFIHIVTFNHAHVIEACLRGVLGEVVGDGKELVVRVTDNASADGTAEIVAEGFGELVSLKRNEQNVGFAAAQNEGILEALELGAEFVLVLNPDLVFEHGAIWTLVEELTQNPRAGMATPKLLRANEDLTPESPAVIDSAGMYFTPSMRHFDRGSGELDVGQFELQEYVFGGTGAALLLKRACIEDLLRGKYGEVFDPKFFAYREDADLAWRAQILGWKCLYVPRAVGFHVRRVLPERRGKLPKEINSYSVRNRFFLQIKNFSLLANWQQLPAMMWRNFVVVCAVLLKEQSSIPALRDVWQGLPLMLKKRKELFSRRRVHPFSLSHWFSGTAQGEVALQSSQIFPVQSVRAVVVNYNSGHRLKGCIDALLKASASLSPNLQLFIHVVDNGSADSSATTVSKYFADTTGAKLDFAGENLGFARALNRAYLNAEEDAILVLNPDVEVTATSLALLCSSLEKHDSLGAVAPVLVSADGKVQHGFTVRTFPTLGSTLAELFFIHRLWPNNPWTTYHLARSDFVLFDYLNGTHSKKSLPKEFLEIPYVVQQPAGACLLIRRECFQAVNGFDEQFFPAWFEDVDFCKRLPAAGFACAVNSEARVTHEGGYSFKHIGLSTFAKCWYPNMLAYWKKYGSRWEYVCLRALLPVALLIRSLLQLISATTLLTKPTRAKTLLGNSWTLLRLAFGARARKV